MSEDEQWYLPELNKNVDGSNLFRTPTGVLKSLRRKIDAEINRRKNDCRPHPSAIPTKVRYLWVVEGGCGEETESRKKNIKSSGA